jgi:hypothetical protein
MLALDSERFSRLQYAGERNAHHTRRPGRHHLDSDGLGLHVEIPAPKVLADYVALRDDVEGFRAGGTLQTRPKGSTSKPVSANALDLAEDLLQVLRALPEVAGARRPYTDLRLFAAHSSAARAYCADVVQAVRASLPEVPEEKPERAPRGPAKTGAQRVAQHRAKVRAEEEQGVAFALGLFLEDDEDGDAPEPGSLVPATLVRDYVSEVLERAVEEWEERVEDPTPDSAEALMTYEERVEEWQESAEDDVLPATRPHLVTPRRLYAIATRFGFEKRRTHGTDFLRTPTHTTEESHMTVAEALLDRAARMLLEENREALDALLRQETPTTEAAPVRHLRAV